MRILRLYAILVVFLRELFKRQQGNYVQLLIISFKIATLYSMQ